MTLLRNHCEINFHGCKYLFQSNEVGGANNMELEGLKRALVKIEEGNVQYKILVTDRHGPVRKYMRTEKKGKKHYFDVFHVAKRKYILQFPISVNVNERMWLTCFYPYCT